MGRKILVVDDELDFIRIMTKALEQAGYEIDAAVNGREAIGAYLESLQSKKPFSLILLDIRLPDLNGIEVLQIIRKEEKIRDIKENARVPIIMLTAYDEPWMDPTLIKGSDDYMLKSSNNEELLKKIEEKLKGNC